MAEGDRGERSRRRRIRRFQPSNGMLETVMAPLPTSAQPSTSESTSNIDSASEKKKRFHGRRARKPKGSGVTSTSEEELPSRQHQSMLSVEAPAFQISTAKVSQPKRTVEEQNTASDRPVNSKQGPKKGKRSRRTKVFNGGIATTSGEAVDDTNSMEANSVETSCDAPMCLLCCATMTLCSFGACNHRAACGPCCLRMRMCYNQTDCPLCKTELKEVVIAPWRPSIPKFSYYASNLDATCARAPGKQLGPGTVFVDRWVSDRQPPSSRLLQNLIRSTGIACSVCDRGGNRPFVNLAQLASHLRMRHRRHACAICLREGRSFPLDSRLYSSETELKEHKHAAHPVCSFCRSLGEFYDGDALWAHLMEKHYSCQLCQPPPGGDYPWYCSADDLQQHLLADHFACEEAECESSLVAFATADELRRHHIERHSTRMPRWNAATSRPLPLDIQFVRRPGEIGRRQGFGAGGDDPSQGRGRRRRAPREPRPFQRGFGFSREVEGGVHVIDDDLGLLNEVDWYQGEGGSGGSLISRGAWAGRNSGSTTSANRTLSAGDAQNHTHFPSLSAATAAAAAPTPPPLEGLRSNVPSRRRPLPPPLVKRTVRCACGRRKTHCVVEEGQDAPELDCDALCNLQGRRAQLADAFGVDNPDRHVSTFDRKPAEWSGELLAAAKRHRAWVEGVERELAIFLADTTLKRHAMQPMSRPQRAIVHGIAEQYGIATASTGHEPMRRIELFKSSSPSASVALPSRLLSRVALAVTDEEIAELLHAAQGFTVKFFDIAPTTNLHYYLRRWEGKHSVEWTGGSEAIVRFDEECDQKEMLEAFGGGIRGMFRIDRQWKLQTSISTSGAATRGGDVGLDSSSSSCLKRGEEGRGWEKAVTAGGDSDLACKGTSEGDPTWTAVASSDRGVEVSRGQDHIEEKGGGGAPAVPAGWAVIGRGMRAIPRRVCIEESAPAGPVQKETRRLGVLKLDDTS